MMIHGYDIYKEYLAFKNHFSNPKYDYFQYEGKVRASEKTYQQRTDFWFFETLSRKLSKKEEVQQYMLASFTDAEDPSKVWIGDIKRSGETNYLAWCKRVQSLNYAVLQDFDRLVEHMESKGYSFDDLFETVGGSPPLFRFYIKGGIGLESFITIDNILHFMVQWDRELKDPLWERLSFKIKKYRSFLSLPTQYFKQELKQRVLNMT